MTHRRRCVSGDGRHYIFFEFALLATSRSNVYSCDITLFLRVQIATLRQEHADLLARRESLENEYCVDAMATLGVTDKHVIIPMIEESRLRLQKNKGLRAIYEDHQALLSKEAALEKAHDRAESTRV